MKSDEIGRLIDELLDGSISGEEFLRLEEELENSAGARAAYYERLKLNTVLQLEAEAAPAIPEVVVSPTWGIRSSWLAVAATVVLMLMTGSLGWWIGRTGSLSSVAASEPVASGFAVVAEHSGAVWKDQPSLDRGDLVPEGILELESGAVQLDLFSGVTVIVEGRAVFRILSPMEMQVQSGRIRALVPEHARGFRVKTSAGDVVDLGTEFALDVKPESADIRVLDGEVEWHPPSDSMRLLKNGESLRWNEAGEASGAVSDSEEVPTLIEIERRLRHERLERRTSWIQTSKKGRDDPRLLTYYTLNDLAASRRQVVDQSPSHNNGTIVRTERVADRWEQPFSALEFSPTGSSIRLNVPGEHRSLTFYCWIKINSLDRSFNSLFLTDGYDMNEPHWQIFSDGRLAFSIRAREKDGSLMQHMFASVPFWTPDVAGKWMQIATVFDMDAATTTHYVDGKAISVVTLPPEQIPGTLRIGPASIGNWSEPTRKDPNFAVRNLNGAIDEFALFSAALPASEILRLYEAGRP